MEITGSFFKAKGQRMAVALARDITERRLAQKALRETRDYLENLIGYANAPIIVWDPDGRITLFNHAFERLTGYAADEVISQQIRMLFPEERRDESLSRIASALAGEYWETVEIPILCKDGSVRIGLWNSANIYAVDGKTVLATIAQGTDITELKRAAEALRESEAQYRGIFDSATDSFVIFDFDGNIVEANSKACRMHGYSHEELIKLSGKDIVHPGYYHLFEQFK
ncbi:MAG: PAS domain S-box protein, partial [Desulfobacterales bacterium]|nr:PAS domain S-box protein [Desulfobacterales bacterium]